MGRNKLSLASCLILLVLIGLTAGLSSCGGGGGNRPVTKPGDEVIITPPENGAPIILQALEDITPPPTSGAFRWESEALTEYFSDPDGDTLQFSAQTDNADVSRVEVSETGVLIVHVSEPATARITVTATDPRGATATQHFSVTVTDTEPTEEPPPADHSDTQSGAVKIAPGQTLRGEFHSADDVDWLRLELPGPGVVELQFDAPTGAEITVFDQNGNVLASGETQSLWSGVIGGGAGAIWIRLSLLAGAGISLPVISTPVLWGITAVLIVRFIYPDAPSITLKPGVRTSISKDIKKYVECIATNPEKGGCKFEFDTTGTVQLHVDGQPIGGTLEVIKGSLVVDLDISCDADQDEFDVFVPVRVSLSELFGIPIPHTIPVPDFKVRVNIERAHEVSCRPKTGTPENPDDGPELPTSLSVDPGEDSASITLTDHVFDPRKGKLSFSTIKVPDGVTVDKQGPVWTIEATEDAEAGEKIVELRAKSTKPNDPPGSNYENEFTLRVSVDGCRVLQAWSHYSWAQTHHHLAEDAGVRYEYTGACSDGYADGRGKYSATHPSGASWSYNGEWDGGIPGGGVGAWRFSVPDEGVVHYDGEVRRGVPHGQGTATWEYNVGLTVSYSGTWNDGVYHGQGTLVDADSLATVQKVGEFRDGWFLYGTLTLIWHASGSTTQQKGEFRFPDAGLWNGTSTKTFSDGSTQCTRYVSGRDAGRC